MIVTRFVPGVAPPLVNSNVVASGDSATEREALLLGSATAGSGIVNAMLAASYGGSITVTPLECAT